jgi:hypothetical protein
MSRYTGIPLKSRLYWKRISKREAGTYRSLRAKLQQRIRRGRQLRLKNMRPAKESDRVTQLVRKQSFVLMQRRDGSMVLSALHPDWKHGNRVFYRVLQRRDLMVSRVPTGAFLRGKLQSSRVKRISTGSPIRRWRWITQQDA